MKRLLAFHRSAPDPKGKDVTFTLESEGGEFQTFAVNDELFRALIQFLLDIDRSSRRGRDGQPDERMADLLQPQPELDIVIDMTEGRALLKAQTGIGRSVQLELSEEVLVRLQVRLPIVLEQLRKRKADRSH
jgi:hypothetical protein